MTEDDAKLSVEINNKSVFLLKMKELTEPILVTGAGGFIGSHLAEALTGRGYHVRAMVHYNFQNSWGWLEEVLWM